MIYMITFCFMDFFGDPVPLLQFNFFRLVLFCFMDVQQKLVLKTIQPCSLSAPPHMSMMDV